MKPGRTFRSGGKVLAALCAVFALDAVHSLLSGGVGVWQAVIYRRWEAGWAADAVGRPRPDAAWADLDAEFTAAENAAAALDLPGTVLSLCGVVLTVYLTWRAAGNAHLLAEGVRTSRAWAVAGYFVPIVNVVAPYRALSEFFRASRPRGAEPPRDRAAWGAGPVSAALPLWWWGTLLSGAVSLAAVVLVEAAGEEDLRRLFTGYALWSAGRFGLAACTLAGAVMFVRLFQAQSLRFAEVFAATDSPPAHTSASS